MTTYLSADDQTLETFSLFSNCTSGYVTFINQSQCSYADMGQQMNLSEYLAQIRDPDEHINMYAGRVKLPYAGDIWLNQFILSIWTNNGMVYENLFFGEDDGQL